MLLCTACGPAAAQFGGSIAIDTDYRFRGVTLSDGRPDARIGVAYDDPAGWYGGASLTRVIFEPGRYHAALSAYAGYTQAWTPTLRWEAGATRTWFDGDARYDYSEAYVGLGGDAWSARAYLSGNYYGSDVHTGYLELDGSWPLAASLRAIAHLGALLSLHGELDDGRSRLRTDARLGARWHPADGVALQLAWTGSSTGGPYASAYERKRAAIVLSVSCAF